MVDSDAVGEITAVMTMYKALAATRFMLSAQLHDVVSRPGGLPLVQRIINGGPGESASPTWAGLLKEPACGWAFRGVRARQERGMVWQACFVW